MKLNIVDSDETFLSVTKEQKVYGELGRVFLALIFILSGLMKFAAWNQNVAFMLSKGIPAAPVLLFVAAVIELVGGFSIVFGFHGKFFGTLLFLYLIPVTLIFHNFWNVTGNEKMVQMINFLKNLAIMGGLIQYAVHEWMLEPLRDRTPLDLAQPPLRKAPMT